MVRLLEIPASRTVVVVVASTCERMPASLLKKQNVPFCLS